MNHSPHKSLDWNVLRDKLHSTQKDPEPSPTVDGARVQAMLKKRAKRLAAGERPFPTAGPTTPVLVFRVGDETYGVELRHVAQVFSETQITPVPGAPESLLGVANLQGEVRPVFGLQRLLALPESENTTSRYILLLRMNSRRVGLLVEHIEGARPCAFDSLSEHEGASVDNRARYVVGMTPDKVIILQTDRLFET